MAEPQLVGNPRMTIMNQLIHPKKENDSDDSDDESKGNGKRQLTTKGQFGLRIVLPHDKPVVHKTEYLPNGHLSIIITGSSGSGKSHMLLELLPQIANISQIIIASLVPSNPVYRTIRKWCDEEDIEFYLVNNPDEGRSVIEQAISEKDKGKQGVVCFDDFTQQKPSRSDPYNQLVNMTSAMLRNHGYHSIFITQSYTNVPTLYRNNANVRVFFTMNDIHAIRSIKKDILVGKSSISEDDFDSLFALIMRQEHAYLMAVNKGAARALYIWLPQFGEETPPRLVTKARADELGDDNELKRLITKYTEASGSGDALSKMTKHQIYKAIQDYIKYIARQRGEDVEETKRNVMEIYPDVDL